MKTKNFGLGFFLLLCLQSIAVFGNNPVSETYAVVVAVADYQYQPQGAGGDLNYTDDDARKFYRFLCAPEGFGVNPRNVELLIDQSATKRNIIGTLNRVFAKAKPQDKVIFYFSGHGLPGYLLPSDVNSNQASQLSFKELKACFKKSSAKTKLCFIDSCFANSIRTGSKKKQKTASDADKPNIVVMVSSQSFQTSIETGQFKQGVFTYYLIQGMKGAADTDDNRLITIKELHSFVYQNVKKYTVNTQVPHTFGDFDRNMVITRL